MKLPNAGNSLLDKSPYAKRNPLWRRWLTFILVGSFMLVPALLVYLISPHGEYDIGLSGHLHNSEPKTKNLNLSGVSVTVSEPIDHRTHGYIFQKPNVMKEIQNKIGTDMAHFGANQINGEPDKNLTIKTTVNVFYPASKGKGWITSIARVSLDVTASLNDSTIITKNYQSNYSSAGLDRDYEGNLVTTDWEAANATLGVSLRRALDQFYTDLAQKFDPPATQLKNVLFKVGSTDFEDDTETDLLAVVGIMKSNPKTAIELDGYSDNLGDLIKDKELSRERVMVVKSFLVHHGIKERRIKTKALGATRPISTNHDEESRRLNRRVEFVIVKS